MEELYIEWYYRWHASECPSLISNKVKHEGITDQVIKLHRNFEAAL